MIAAWIFVGLCLVLCLFQLALIGGAPWGHLTQGGQQRGALTPRARGMAALSMAIIVFMALGILSAGGSWPHWPEFASWLALWIMSLSSIANWLTPSTGERLIWGPVSLVMLGCALFVLITGPERVSPPL